MSVPDGFGRTYLQIVPFPFSSVSGDSSAGTGEKVIMHSALKDAGTNEKANTPAKAANPMPSKIEFFIKNYL